MGTFTEYNAATHPIVKLVDDWNNLLAHGLQKPWDLLVTTDGTDISATSGANGKLLYGGSGDYGGIDGGDAHDVVQAALDSISGTNGTVLAKNGTYDVDTAIDIPDQTSLWGQSKKSTIFAPSANVHVFRITGSSGYKYRQQIHNLAIVDAAHNQTNTSGIYVDNKSCHLAFPDLSDLYIEDCFNGIACAPTLDANTNKIHTPTWERLHIEICRNQGIFINNAIDMRANNWWMSIGETQASYGINFEAPATLSCGSYFDGITVIDNYKTLTSDKGIRLNNINESFWHHVIVDCTGDDCLTLDTANYNRFIDTFLLSGGNDGVVLSGTSNVNYFSGLIVESMAGYGVSYNVAGQTNYLHNYYMSGNVTGDFEATAGTLKRTNLEELPTVSRGLSTGTGAQQTIAHGLQATPTYVWFGNIEDGANPYQSAAADAVNIYVTAVNLKDYAWKAEY